MTFSEVAKLIAKARKQALRVAAEQVITTVTPFVPIGSGALRRSQRVVETPNGVEIDWQSLEYSKYQYNKNLHHLGTRGDYRSIGDPSSKQYSQRYRKAKSEGRLTPSRAKWFDAVLTDKVEQRRLANTYTNAIKRLLA